MVPNVARAWDWNADKSQLTVHLREGIRWSDGEPFTAEDLRFYFEDVQFNEQLTPLTPGAWMSHGSRMTFTQIDDSTVQFGFAGPSPAQLFMFTAANGYMNHYFPAHYFKDLHIDYNEDANAKAKEEGLEGVVAAIQPDPREDAALHPLSRPTLPVRLGAHLGDHGPHRMGPQSVLLEG